MKLLKFIWVAIAAALLRAQDTVMGLTPAANTYDAAVEVHDCAITRTNEAAVSTRHLLWKQGTTAGEVAVCTAADIPLGTIDNVETAVDQRQSILLLGKGKTKKMVASEEITAGERVFAAAAGKVSDLPAAVVADATYQCVGVALTGSGADDDIIEVADCQPFPITVAGTG